MEEGTQSSWLYEILSPLVEEMVVVGVVERARGNKNDTEDAFGLAEMLRTRSYSKNVYKKVGRFKKLRALVKGHGFLTRDTVRSCNRLKAAYRSEGISTSGREIFAEGASQAWLPRLPEGLQESAGILHMTFDALDGLKTAAERAMVVEARKHADYRLLQTVPGFGPIRAAQLLAVVVTPSRFRTARQFWKYCGFGVVTHSSADWVVADGKVKRKKVQQTRGLNQDHNHVMKNVFKGAAMTVVQMGHGPLYDCYMRLVNKGTKPNLAMLTVARKIAAISLSVWKHQAPFDEERARHASTKTEPPTSDQATTT
jgi:hypothetical protein